MRNTPDPDADADAEGFGFGDDDDNIDTADLQDPALASEAAFGFDGEQADANDNAVTTPDTPEPLQDYDDSTPPPLPERPDEDDDDEL